MDLFHNISRLMDQLHAIFPAPHHTVSPHSHTSLAPSLYPVSYHYTYTAAHSPYLQIPLRRDNNGLFLHNSSLIDNHPVIPLMVFQVIMILAIIQRDISLFREQQFGDIVFIDHIPAIVRCCGNAAYLMNCAELRSICSIQIRNRTFVRERYLTWQILKIILNLCNVFIQIFRQIAILIIDITGVETHIK